MDEMFVPEFSINIRVKPSQKLQAKIDKHDKLRKAEQRLITKVENAHHAETTAYANYMGDLDEGRNITESRAEWRAAEKKLKKLEAALTEATLLRKEAHNAMFAK